jgi:hypothetical protein
MSNIGSELNSFASNTFNFTNNLLANSSLIFIVAVIIILYVVLGGSSNNENGSSYNNEGSSYDNEGSSIIGSIITIVLLLIIFIIVIKLILGFDIIKYFYNFDIYEYLYDLFYPKPIELPSLPKLKDLSLRKQVFNVSQNTYVYDDAKAVCSAYGARLATYKEVEDSYEDGGEWCNYGWSKDQLALFPTQQKTYDELQKIKGHENDCGRPGVNGGFIANPNLRFGVNCYGKKPQMTQAEEELMATQPIYPQTVEDIALEDRVKYWKDKLDTIMISPFNHDTWSKF